jgi:hypothetical protein
MQTTSSSDISKFPQLSSILNRFQIENRRSDSVSFSLDQMGASQNDPSDECRITLSEKESGNCSCHLSTVMDRLEIQGGKSESFSIASTDVKPLDADDLFHRYDEIV